jgi:hypothetical protein
VTYREFIARLKDFGVAEYKGRGKGGERFLYPNFIKEIELDS